jgi:glycerophosphoryl diester phosphodiesterase
LIAWKVNDEARMRALLDLGATGICSSAPELLGRLK